MTTLNFKDALAELVRQFPAANPDKRATALGKLSDLSVASDQTDSQQAAQADEDDWFENFTV